MPSNTPTQHNSPATPHPSGFPPWEYELAELRAWLIAQPGSCFEDLTLEKLENETAFILEGLRHGFIVADTFPPPYEESYPVSAENETLITADLAEERSSGRIFPALSKPQWVTPHFVKIEGTPLKPKYRIIRDFTVVRAHGDPDFASVNDVAWHDTFKMSSVDDAFASMKPNAFMAKVDISKAYRAVPVHPSQWELLSYKWHGVYYSDTRLPFGLRNAPEIFCRLTAMVRFFMIRRGHMAVVYVDDFFNTHITMANCQAAYDCLLLLLRSLGFTVNEDKCTPPCKDLVFLGVRLQTDASSDNSGAMVASVPPTKLTEILELIASCRPFKVIPTRQWQRLMGRLNFISRVIYGARPYSRRPPSEPQRGPPHGRRQPRPRLLDELRPHLQRPGRHLGSPGAAPSLLRYRCLRQWHWRLLRRGNLWGHIRPAGGHCRPGTPQAPRPLATSLLGGTRRQADAALHWIQGALRSVVGMRPLGPFLGRPHHHRPCRQ